MATRRAKRSHQELTPGWGGGVTLPTHVVVTRGREREKKAAARKIIYIIYKYEKI